MNLPPSPSSLIWQSLRDSVFLSSIAASLNFSEHVQRLLGLSERINWSPPVTGGVFQLAFVAGFQAVLNYFRVKVHPVFQAYFAAVHQG